MIAAEFLQGSNKESAQDADKKGTVPKPRPKISQSVKNISRAPWIEKEEKKDGKVSEVPQPCDLDGVSALDQDHATNRFLFIPK